MRRLVFAFLFLPMAALAQQTEQHPHQPKEGGSVPLNGMPMSQMQMMDHGSDKHHMHMQMMSSGRNKGTDARNTIGVPIEPGQSAFAAIQEIAQILEDDPRTDWSKVNVEALRQHLIDMNNVTLAAHVSSEPIDGGLKFVVTGEGAVRDSIRRMTSAHAATMDGFGGWRFKANDTDGGSIVDIRAPPQDLNKLKGLGLMGVLTRGMHHQEHHLMIARGEHPHR